MKPAYQTIDILNLPNCEVRFYNAQYRNVILGYYGTNRYLAMPPIVFVRRVYQGRVYLYAQMTKAIFLSSPLTSLVSPIPIYPVEDAPVCLDEVFHYSQPITMTLSDLIRKFWGTPLIGPGREFLDLWREQSLDRVDSFLFQSYENRSRKFSLYVEDVLTKRIPNVYV